MIFDLLTWAIVLLGGAMLVAGGLVLRGGTDGEREDERGLEGARDEARRASAEATKMRTLIERLGYEHEAERLALEAQVDELRAELAAKTTELAVETELARELEASLTATRAALHAAEAPRKDAEKAARAPEPPKAAAPKPLPPPDPAAQARLGELERTLELATSERDAAKEKIASLERLVEGVRARSRDLVKEIAELKSTT